MRKFMILAATAACAIPAAAAADPPSSSTPNPSQTCSAERTRIGQVAFGQLYGTNANRANAFGKCVAKQAALQRGDAARASARCRAEQDDANFAATHGGKTFTQFYGTNANGRNAFGKCVSGKARAANDARQRTEVNAARACRAEQLAGPAAFRVKYGTNANKSNAFGRCVSAKARAQNPS